MEWCVNMSKVRTSKYGFYCAVCNKFVYQGFDSRDDDRLTNAVCVSCGVSDYGLKV